LGGASLHAGDWSGAVCRVAAGGALLMSTGPRGHQRAGRGRVMRREGRAPRPERNELSDRAAALSHRCGPLPSFGSIADRPAVRPSRAQGAVRPWHGAFQPRSWPSQAHYKQAARTAGEAGSGRPRSHAPDDHATSEVNPLAENKSIARSGGRPRDRHGPTRAREGGGSGTPARTVIARMLREESQRQPGRPTEHQASATRNP
jgi:hypothetical protein